MADKVAKLYKITNAMNFNSWFIQTDIVQFYTYYYKLLTLWIISYKDYNYCIKTTME